MRISEKVNTAPKRTANLDKAPISQKWEQIDWTEIENFVSKIQTRIAKASEQRNKRLVVELQRMLRHSFYAKLLAVRKVITNKGGKTCGIDNVLWDTPAKRYKAAQELTTKNYKPMPLKRVYILKPSGKKRPLGIPTLRDRAVQCLESMALDPLIESISDLRSFGFRKSRSSADARELLFVHLSRKLSPQWVLEGDIKACFDEISHDWLLNNTPMDRQTLTKILKSGFVDKGQLFPTKSGTPQGGIISPILANHTLNGLDDMIKREFKATRKTKTTDYYNPMVYLVRYADDFVITARTKEIAEAVKESVKDFLAERGLQLSEEKTLITEIYKGFDFLGWNFRKYSGDKLLIKPSKQSIQKVINQFREIINKHRGVSQDVLISKLNPVITGWSNYHQGAVSRKAFEKVDHLLFQMLWKWATRRHDNKGKRWIKNKYWKVEGSKHWVFKGDVKRLKKMSDVKIIRHIRLKLNQNPYIHKEYFESRKLKLEANKLTGRAKRVWLKQDGLCPSCGTQMEDISQRKMYDIKPIDTTKKSNLMFIHKACIHKFTKSQTGVATLEPCFL